MKGWNEIAEFLGQTISVAQRWQKSGMPVTREGQSVYASTEELTAWVEDGLKKHLNPIVRDTAILGNPYILKGNNERRA